MICPECKSTNVATLLTVEALSIDGRMEVLESTAKERGHQCNSCDWVSNT